MNEGQYSAPMPRAVALAAGVVSALFGVPLLLLGGFVIFSALKESTPTSMEVIGCVALAVGAFMSLLAYRLISNKPRSDGGLVPPWALRVAGMGFIAGAPFYVWVNHSMVSAWHALGLVTAGLACFGIATYRERKRE
jgi:hypothetical protein